MSERDWSDLDRRLDDAIDALNDERAPEVEQSDDERQLLDVVRVVRRLRGPVEPDTDFVDQLVVRTLAGVSMSSLSSYSNGSSGGRLTTAIVPVRSTSRRYRLILGQIAAVLRVVGVFVLAGMLAGAIVGGLGGRAAMRVSGYIYQRENPDVRVVTESSGEPVGQISLSGTMNLIVESMGSGAVIGLLLLLVAPWLPRSGWRRAGTFGLLLLAVVGSLVIDPDSHDLRMLGSPLLNVVMFATLIVAAGMMATTLIAWIERAVAANNSRLTRMGATILGAVVVVLGGLALLLSTLMLLINSVTVPVNAFVDPGLSTLLIAPLILIVLIAIPLARVADAFPSHLTALDGLRSPLATRFFSITLRLVIAAGVLIFLINALQIISS